ncbi:MAG TPA: bifunctional riboflavin kinase/FAD synthetase [Flavobacteriia bacterium]|nr:bifunctional riboflavin kinase/FAD synthetase [Flavobacteriia bacterium]
MKLINGLENYKSTKKSIVTLGTFDGVHIGHQKIIAQLNKNKQDAKSVLLTFFPHPRMVLQDATDLKLLNTIDEKKQLLAKFGLDTLIIEPFTKEFSKLTALEFVRNVLINKLNTKKLVIGYDHRFGKNREGDFEHLSELSDLYEFDLEQIPAQDIKEVSVSSTKIRKALENGEIEKANSYLGYNYLLTGKVVHGRGLGKKWHYPTINLAISENYKLIPKSGVYIVKSTIKDKNYYGIMNIGNRPTVNGKHQTIEVHLLDFNQDIYGEKIQVAVLKRIRDEKKFPSVEALIAQIKLDEKEARLFLGE